MGTPPNTARPVPISILFYVSRAARPLAVPELRRLLGGAQVANRRANITGVLAYTGQYFAQILEGPEAVIDALAERIAADHRHIDFRLLHRARQPVRDFPEWSMELIESPQLETELAALSTTAPDDADAVPRTLDRIKREAQWRTVSEQQGSTGVA